MSPAARPRRNTLHSRELDYRQHPEQYQVGRGEQGVLTVQPYKSELLPLWRFRTPAEARRSAVQLYRAFGRYRRAGDFVGMDMARKFLQMGLTRASRYAHHAGGRKYDARTGEPLQASFDPLKAESAEIFRRAWERVRADAAYQQAKAAHAAARRQAQRRAQR